ncbi:hypothetical protein B0H14DRAFT_2657666 [Mycena olivaceomarginata]|nr:hypothetical protein B0H14DRAFT_2657666 [Mycena olivaceomarginata]
MPPILSGNEATHCIQQFKAYKHKINNAYIQTTRRVPKSKVGEGTAGRLKAESSVQPLANEREKFENASPRRSQRLKPQGQHLTDLALLPSSLGWRANGIGDFAVGGEAM